ncbi:Carbohydrate kinase PfkB [uncultured Caudovirales phage]|uniref:Carbohydrate kinase PfkB n=1 Tax=uncultured Caudovirales phage TaxID=2100421 RepID=A0A6J5LNE4_9CAUD|nr:Carbohydrate kinase PfkB [uncultured Caudovirales phage]
MNAISHVKELVISEKLKVLLIGDNGVDQYQYGTVSRISPEAPVPIINYTHTVTKPGMAANVKDNLEKLGCDVKFVHGIRTCTKTRIIDSKSKQHLVRIDQDELSKPVKIDYSTVDQYDAIVISDYNKGSVEYETVIDLRKNYSGPIFVDTKKTDLARFDGCYVKINKLEYDSAKTYPTELIVTLGRDGVRYKEYEFSTPQVEAFDVCGAGDTFLSALAFEYVITKDILKAINFATRAASVTIQHVGVYSPTVMEINREYKA